MTRETVPRGPQGTYYLRPLYQDRETEQPDLIYIEKHREAAETGGKHVPREGAEQSSRERTKRTGDERAARHRFQTTMRHELRRRTEELGVEVNAGIEYIKMETENIAKRTIQKCKMQ